MEPKIETQLNVSQIDGKRIRYSSADGSFVDVDAMLETYEKPDGTMSVIVVSPYDIHALGSRPLQVTEYGSLTQEEFDRYMTA